MKEQSHKLRLGMSSLLTALILAFTASSIAQPSSRLPDEIKISGFAVGCQAYTFNRFSVFEAIEKTAQAGGKTIEFYPGQKFSEDEPNLKWDHHATPEMIEKV